MQKLILYLIVIFLAPQIFAESSTNLDFPLVDSPFNKYAYPSMDQSLNLSTDFYQFSHFLIGKSLKESPFWNHFATVALDMASFSLPLSSSWLHEEWHRAVMLNHRISSHDGVNDAPIGKTLISVNQVSDADLSLLKQNHPADFVRLEAAGMEAQTEQNLYFEKQFFYMHSKTWDQIVMFYNAISNTAYISTCNNPSSSATTDKQNSEESNDIAKRDFTGLDCLGWVYDLFRPTEPYSARGIHPSGLGINRYRKIEDLTLEEKGFLAKQQSLSLLNFINPFLFGKTAFEAQLFGAKIDWNFSLAHYLTSFGYAIDTNLFLSLSNWDYFISVHQYFNNKKSFPGINLELVHWKFFSDKLKFNLALTQWQQPKDQLVSATESSFGKQVSFRSYYKVSTDLEPYFGISTKDPGWVAGEVSLEKSTTSQFGFLYWL